LAEYLIYHKKKVNLIDTDPNQTLQTWIGNCREEKRQVSFNLPVAYQIIDTAGVSSGSLAYLKRADLILVPFVPHYTDLQIIIPWFVSLPKERKQRVTFLPNRYQKTKEQQEGLNQLDETRRDYQAGTILPSLSNRPALYGSVLNGSPNNFFANSKKSADISNIFQKLFHHYKHYEKNK
jgi:cellulose biosynthesis protein BcsQ